MVNHVGVFTFPSFSFYVRSQFSLVILVCLPFLLFLPVYDIVSNWFFCVNLYLDYCDIVEKLGVFLYLLVCHVCPFWCVITGVIEYG